MLAKIKPLRDRKYLASFHNAACYACGLRDGTVVPAHIRSGFFALGMKPGDDMTLPLCGGCHALQHRVGEAVFWKHHPANGPFTGVGYAKAAARARYQAWKDKQ